ncbi:unnamed protein product, partial [Prorocentrum cordatum]
QCQAISGELPRPTAAPSAALDGPSAVCCAQANEAAGSGKEDGHDRAPERNAFPTLDLGPQDPEQRATDSSKTQTQNRTTTTKNAGEARTTEALADRRRPFLARRPRRATRYEHKIAASNDNTEKQSTSWEQSELD